MTEPYGYVVVGRGHWASRMRTILAGEGRPVTSLNESRRGPAEPEESYRERLRDFFAKSAAQIAWLCVPPGHHIPVMVQSALDAGLHVIVEKPWFCSLEETGVLEALARGRRLMLGIHYEYCLMEQVASWRREWHGGSGLNFGGRMKIQRANHLGLPALENLGSHLFAIQEYCVPQSTTTEMDCGYEQKDERRAWLDKNDQRVAEIDLLANKEPIIQRFIAQFEKATREGQFPFTLQFGFKVAQRVALWRQRAPD
jgi:Oxidoreductase family, NAD-binding Rossmann fold